MNLSVRLGAGLTQDDVELLVVDVILNDRLPPVTPIHQMVN